MTKAEDLKAFFKEGDLEWRVQSCGMKSDGKPYAMVLCYIQARAIQNRLDKVLGFENWKDEYRVEGTNIICRLSVKIEDEWIAKENGASETDIEAFKGGISGAFKRVASSGFGIGRYLYDLENTYADCSIDKRQGWHSAKTREGKYIYWNNPKMLPKFLPSNIVKEEPKKTFDPTSPKDVYEQVAKPVVVEGMKEQLLSVIESAMTRDDLTNCSSTSKKFEKHWQALESNKMKSYDEVYNAFEKKWDDIKSKTNL